MKVVMIAAIAVALFGFSREALALKESVPVTPESIKSIAGLSVQTALREDGRIRFSVLRDPAKARFQGRDARIEVSGPGTMSIDATLHGSKDKNGLLYEITLSSEAAAHTLFVLSEVETSPGRANVVLGGGIFYSILARDFVAPDDPRKQNARPR